MTQGRWLAESFVLFTTAGSLAATCDPRVGLAVFCFASAAVTAIALVLHLAPRNKRMGGEP